MHPFKWRFPPAQDRGGNKREVEEGEVGKIGLDLGELLAQRPEGFGGEKETNSNNLWACDEILSCADTLIPIWWDAEQRTPLNLAGPNLQPTKNVILFEMPNLWSFLSAAIEN